MLAHDGFEIRHSSRLRLPGELIKQLCKLFVTVHRGIFTTELSFEKWQSILLGRMMFLSGNAEGSRRTKATVTARRYHKSSLNPSFPETIMTFLRLAALLIALAAAPVLAETEALPAEQIRAVIQKSIPYIEQDGEKWIKVKKCNSCHMIPFMVWSLHEAESRGIKVNSKRLAELDDWSAQAILPKDPKKKPPKGSETQAQLLIIRAGYGGEIDETFQKILARVVSAQQENGQWEAGGQLPSQKRPKLETEEVSTMWNLLALHSVEEAAEQRPKLEEAASKWLSSSELAQKKSAKSAEWFTARLLLEVKRGEEQSIALARDELLKLQRADGGWGWLTGSESDALATGPAIYALTQSGLTGDDEPVRRAVTFLLETQLKDGTWRVESTRARDKGAVKPTSIYWGTTWAAIGLSQLLPVQKTPDVAQTR
jgi:hypothetical protein